MEVTNLLTFTSRQQLREWLEHNHLTEKCCWVACNRSKTPRPDALPYIDIVEEAFDCRQDEKAATGPNSTKNGAGSSKPLG